MPNIIGYLSWLPIYLLPGILAGMAISIPPGESTGEFRLLLLAAVLLLWLACWLLWRLARSIKRAPDRLNRLLPPALAAEVWSAWIQLPRFTVWLMSAYF